MRAGLLRPAVRAWIRHVPVTAGKAWLWRSLAEPYFACYPHRFVVRTRFGARIAGDTSEYLQQLVYYFGVWEPNLTAWLSRRLQPGDVFVDGMEPLLRNGRDDLEVVVEIGPARLASQARSAEDLFSVFHRFGFFAYHLVNDYDPVGHLPGAATQPPAASTTSPRVMPTSCSRGSTPTSSSRVRRGSPAP